MANGDPTQDMSITPPGLNEGPVDLSAGVPMNTLPQNLEAPRVEDYYPDRFKQDPIASLPPTPEKVNALIDNFVYNTEAKENPLKATSVLGNFHTSDYGQNQFMDRYYNHNKFSELGFSPFLDNETRYNEASSGWDEFERAFWQWTNLSGVAFSDAMSFGDSLTDRKNAEQFKRVMDIGSSTDTGKFATNLFLNSGYTMGIMAELIAEEVVLGATTAALGIASPITGGATAGAAAVTAATMAERARRGLGKITHAWDAMKNVGKTLSSFKDVNKAREYFTSAGKATGRFLNPLENTARFLKQKKSIAGIHEGTKLAKLKTATSGFAEFYKDVRNVRLAFGEGALEGGMVENEMIDHLTKDWLDKHPGQKMSDSAAQAIRNAARDAGVTTTLTNTPVILLSNKIVLDGILRPGQFSKKIIGEVIETGGKKLLFNPRKGVKDVYSILPKGFINKTWAYAKDPRLALSAAATGVIKYSSANFAEGLQETAQEIISGTNEDYYTAQYKGDVTKGGYYSFVAQNVNKQFSPEGFEIFASGFLMGGIAGPISNIAGRTMSTATELFDPNSDLRIRGFKIGEKEDGTGEYVTGGFLGKALGIGTGTQEQISAAEKLDRKRKDALDDVVNTLNEFYDINKKQYLNPELENLLSQKQLNSLMQKAQEEGDVKAYNDFKDTSGFKHVMTALRYGRLGTHIQQLKEQKNLTEEEIKQQYGISKAEFDASIDNAVERAERIQYRYDKAKELFPNPYNPQNYRGNEAFLMLIGEKAWNDAVEEFIFNQDSFDNAVRRTEKILSKAKDKAKLKNTSFSKFEALFSLSKTQAEINTLKQEIEALEESGVKKTDPKLKFLKKQKEYLERFADAMEQTKIERAKSKTESITKRTKNKAERAFKRYVDLLAKESGDFVANEDLTDVFEDLLDYAALSERKQKAMDAANLLTNPQVFFERVERNKEINSKIFANKKAEIKESLEQYLKAMDKNEMLQELHKLGMFFSLEELENLEQQMKDGVLTLESFPKTFYYTNVDTIEDEKLSSLQVQRNTEDYQKAIALVKKYFPHITGIPIEQETVVDPYSASVRLKLKDDNRTFEDLAKQFGFENKEKVPLKDVLQAIIDSKYATAQEKLLASQLLTLASDTETITFATNMAMPGEYSESLQTRIDPRYSASNYAKSKKKLRTEDFGVFEYEGADLPIEVTILRYELERRVFESLNTNTQFSENINELMKLADARFTEMANADVNSVNFAIFPFLHDKAAFIQGAMTSRDFQKFLASIPYKSTKEQKNSWQKFVDFVIDSIKQTLGGKPNGSALNEALTLITSEIGIIEEEKAAPVTEETKTEETVIVEGPISITNNPKSMWSEHKEFMTQMVNLFKQQSKEQEAKGETPLGRFTDKNGNNLSDYAILTTTQFKTWWNKNFNAAKDEAINNYNTQLKEAVELEELESKQQEEPTPKSEQRKSRKDDIKTREMVNKLLGLRFTRPQIAAMSVDDAIKFIEDGVPYPELVKRREEKERLEELKAKQKKQEAIQNIIDKFNSVTSLDELTSVYDTILNAIEENDKNIVEAQKDVNIEQLRLETLKRLAEEVSFDQLKIGKAMRLKKNKNAYIIEVSEDGKTYTAQYDDGTSNTVEITEDNIKDLVQAFYSEAYEQTNEIESEITEEEEKVLSESKEIFDNSSEGVKEAMDSAKKLGKEQARKNFLDAINNRCK
jgi:hypothetical protein